MANVLSEKEKTVIQYIRDYEAKGYSDSNIRKALKGSGVDDMTIKKCMDYVKPFYKKGLFWIGVALLIGLGIGGYFLWPSVECESSLDCLRGYDCVDGGCVLQEAECLSDSDCGDGYECDRGSCVLAEVQPEIECYSSSDCKSGYKCVDYECQKKKAEPQCGDGNCDIGEESCILDCGCDTNDECEEIGYDYCDSDGNCVHKTGGGSGTGGGGGGTASTSCNAGSLGCSCNSGVCDSPYLCSPNNVCVACVDDYDCAAGYSCDENIGTCFELPECSNYIDDNGDGFVDLTGGCDLDGDGRMDMVCGCWNGVNIINYGNAEMSCNIGDGESYVCMHLDNFQVEKLDCEDVHGVYYYEDVGCVSSSSNEIDAGVVSGGCIDNSFCDVGKVCVEESCVLGYEDCDNLIDDDNDGLVDCNDDDCDGSDACPSGQVEVCDNFVDDNGDDLVDCEDDDCTGDSACVEVCNDEIDNDQDNLVDCKDDDCTGDPACVEVCNDEIDNDQDNLVDCKDDDCTGDPACKEEVAEEYECNDGKDNDNDGTYDYYGACDVSADVQVMAAPSPEDLYATTVSCSEFVVDTGIVTRAGLAKICKEVCEGDGWEYFNYDTNCESNVDNREATDPIVGSVIGEENTPLSLDAFTPYEVYVKEYTRIEPEKTQQEYILREYERTNLRKLTEAPSLGNFWDTIIRFLFNAF